MHHEVPAPPVPKDLPRDQGHIPRDQGHIPRARVTSPGPGSGPQHGAGKLQLVMDAAAVVLAPCLAVTGGLHSPASSLLPTQPLRGNVWPGPLRILWLLAKLTSYPSEGCDGNSLALFNRCFPPSKRCSEATKCRQGGICWLLFSPFSTCRPPAFPDL